MKLTCVTSVLNAISSDNRERLIRCVESVAKLKTEHEHLIYDGASTDGTFELLRELEAKTPGLKIVSEPDTGIYNALNKGVRDAAGEWFYVLGCDDYVCRPDVMDRILAVPHCAGIIATDVIKGDCDSRARRKISPSSAFWNPPYCHQGVLMRVDLIRKYSGFDEKYRIAADYKLALLCHMNVGVDVEYFPGDDSAFACFGMNGASESNQDLMYREFDHVVAEVLDLNSDRLPFYRARGYLPLCVLSRFAFSHDMALRLSARLMFRIFLRRHLRIFLYPKALALRLLRCGKVTRS